MPFIPEYQIPLHLHSGLKRLLRYVYKHQGKSLAPNANAVIAYFSDDKLGECWVNIHEGSGPWTMVSLLSICAGPGLDRPLTYVRWASA